MEIICNDTQLKIFFRTHIAISELGRRLLASRPGMQLTIVEIKDHPTHFAGLPRPTLHLNVLGEEARWSKKAVASTLVHEVIHAVHRHDDAVAYKLRNTTASLAPGFPNQEEELTITGAIQGSGLRAAIDCENWARRCMGLPERLDYN